MMRANQFALIGVVGIVSAVIGLAAAPPQATAVQPGDQPCALDVVPDGVIDTRDVVAAVLTLGPCADCPADFGGDGVVDDLDLLAIVAGLGSCATSGAPPVAAGTGMHVCAVEDSAFATANGGCEDLATGLVWSTHNMGHGVNWQFDSAAQFIADSTEGGYTDWRFPTVAEMETVAADGAASHFSGFSYCANWSEERQGQYNYATYVTTGETILLRARGAFGGDYGCFVGVREAGVPSACNGNGICEPGENCENCDDCDGVTNGPPSGRYCCGDGVLDPPEQDGRCDGNP